MNVQRLPDLAVNPTAIGAATALPGRHPFRQTLNTWKRTNADHANQRHGRRSRTCPALLDDSRWIRKEERHSEFARLKALGVKFRGEPISMEPISAVLFEDTCGNLINLVQPAVMLSRTFAVCALLIGFVFSAASHAVEIRIRNDTGEDLRNVVVGYRVFGNVGKGHTTQYQTWDKATEIANVSARTASGVMGFRPKKPYLLQDLGEGRFTYVLTLSNGGLAMRAEKDAD